ncbi:ribosomal protein S6 [Aneurinibacillus aneurinilyticus ATCC 12856]|uniref:Small ribosomal subunit protein bS6 n=2 Tax=Aneurinibacillus aneurinilyticus TaxID=1391 RepID=U1W8N8_ANEAE|nr:ribosomal protein S6 [Aneurinibacillus aneurinilyticus ATCC 12856]
MKCEFRIATCETGSLLVPYIIWGRLDQKEVNSMRKYEVMYILRPDLQEEATKANVERFSNVITEDGGEMEKVTEMGKKRLAYEIDDHREGFYVLMNFQSEPQAVNEMERLMKISDDVIRYLVVREDEK